MVLASRFGMGSEPELTLTEIGNRTGFTREWIRVIEKKAIWKLSLPPNEDKAFRAARPA
jgi:DNA-directed RNA polymerase sigma subunit (sigma70/sigma32)